MKKILCMIAVSLAVISCGTKYNYLDTGIANPRFDGNMYEYLMSNSYNWDSIVKMIDRAQLQDVFKKGDITFLGVTNHTIRKWLIKGGSGYDKFGYSKVSDIPESMCRAIILSHVIDGKIFRDDVERAIFDEKGIRVGGGRKVTSKYGTKIWLWTLQDPYMGMPGVGPVSLSMTTLRTTTGAEHSTQRIASTNIQPDNGVVQAIQYSYNIEDMDIIFVD